MSALLKATPGPWRAIKGVEPSDDMRCGVSAMRGEIGYLVATIENGAPGDICDTEFANANLIAAAPELYYALGPLLRVIDDAVSLHISDEELREAHPEDQRFIKRARKALERANAALAKARGES